MEHEKRWRAGLEGALVRELGAAWRQLNESYFKGRLRMPQIVLTCARERLGRWSLNDRAIEISRPMVLEQPWGTVVEVLKHEMAHQFVHEILGASDEAPHGPAFRDTCKRMGIDGAASGVPRSAGEDKVIVRITRLLALAESPNVHEAEAATIAAQKLMLKHNLSVMKDAAARGYAHRHLGRPTGRVIEHERILAMLLGKHFFVEVIWIPVYRALEGKRGSVLEICGTPENLEIAEYVHGYLLKTAERLWQEHARTLQITGNRDRRTFLAGVMTGFADKLARQARAQKEEGLIWVRDADLEHFFRRRHPHIRHIRHAGTRRNEAYTRGREAGQKIVLHRAVREPASDRGRLLRP
jgi:hypothetical protein